MEETPTQYMADDCCVDCGKGVSPNQANIARQRTHEVNSQGVRKGFVLCRKCLDSEVNA